MIRCKITPHFVTGDTQNPANVRIVVEWVDVAEGEVIVGVVATEEFNISAARDGCSYVTRGGFDVGQMQPGTFWIDESGHRHFVVQAEPGYVGLIGEDSQQLVDKI